MPEQSPENKVVIPENTYRKYRTENRTLPISRGSVQPGGKIDYLSVLYS